MRMHLEPTVLTHPTRRQLVAFAESLVDRRASVSALMASHVASCSGCAREVKRIRASLEIAALSPTPEPSRELTPRIIAQARNARRRQQASVRASSGITTLFKYTASVSGIIVLAWFSFSAALDGTPVTAPLASVYATTSGMEETTAPTPGVLQQQTAVVRALSTAVSHQRDALLSPVDTGRRRMIEALDSDLSAALAALERNPGCVRANQVVHMSLERQLEGLRSLYLDRTL